LGNTKECPLTTETGGGEDKGEEVRKFWGKKKKDRRVLYINVIHAARSSQKKEQVAEYEPPWTRNGAVSGCHRKRGDRQEITHGQTCQPRKKSKIDQGGSNLHRWGWSRGQKNRKKKKNAPENEKIGTTEGCVTASWDQALWRNEKVKVGGKKTE